VCGRLPVCVRRDALAERDDHGPALDQAVHDLSEFPDWFAFGVNFESAGVCVDLVDVYDAGFRTATARAREVTRCRDRQARTDQRDRPDRTEPALANEPIDSREASEPADPIDRIELADPTERIDPADPMDRIDPLEPMLRIDPAEPPGRRELSSVRMRPFSQPVGKMVSCLTTRSPS
jgi:hypothetical protein